MTYLTVVIGIEGGNVQGGVAFEDPVHAEMYREALLVGAYGPDGVLMADGKRDTDGDYEACSFDAEVVGKDGIEYVEHLCKEVESEADERTTERCREHQGAGPSSLSLRREHRGSPQHANPDAFRKEK